MREIAVGMRINPKTGPEFFGVDEVNTLINAGWVVVAIKGGGLITTRSGDLVKFDDTVSLVITGFDVIVMLGEPAS